MDYKELYFKYEKETDKEMREYIISIFNDSDSRIEYYLISQEISDHYKKIISSYTEYLKTDEIAIWNAFQNGETKYKSDSWLDYFDAVMELDIDNLIKDYNSENKQTVLAAIYKNHFLQVNLNRFKSYKKYYSLIRDTKKYNYFTFLNLENINLNNSKEYKELYKIKFPNSEIESGGMVITLDDSIFKDDKKNKKHIPSESEHFTDEEKLILRGVFFRVINKEFKYSERDQMRISLHDFNKMISILGSLEDEIELTGKSNSSSKQYSTSLKIYDQYSERTRSDKIDVIISKFKVFNISVINSALKTYKHTGKI